MIQINKELAIKDIDEFIRKEVWGIDEDRIETWLEASDHDVFVNNYVLNNLVEKRSSNAAFRPDYFYFNSITNYLKTIQKRKQIDEFKPLSFESSYQQDLYFCNQAKRKRLQAHHKSRIEKYEDYLYEHLSAFKTIDYLESNAKYPVLGVKDLCTSTVVHKLFEELNTENHLRTILDRMDLVQAYLLKGFKSSNNSYMEEDIIHKLLDAHIQIEISQIQEYPDDFYAYLKAIKSWLTDALDERKKRIVEYTFVYGSVPRFILAIDELLNPKKNLPLTLTEPKVDEPSSKLASPTDYPKHIFSDAAAFAFFDFLVQKCTKTVQVVFLYRQMSEKENPPKIITKYSPFRLWFEKHYKDLDIVLIDKPQTYEMSKTDDRLLLYETAKELFQELKNQHVE